LLIIPGVVIRALIGADEGTASTIVGRVLGGALIVLGSLAHQQGSYARAAHRPCLCRIQRIDGHCSRGRQCRWHSKRDPALAGGCSARASAFGSPRRPVTRSGVTYGRPVTRHWNLRSIRQPSPPTTRSRRSRSRLAGRAAVGAGETAVSTTLTSCVILPASAPSSRDSTLPYTVIARCGLAGVYVRISAAKHDRMCTHAERDRLRQGFRRSDLGAWSAQTPNWRH
jgi:hypothetical protein